MKKQCKAITLKGQEINENDLSKTDLKEYLKRLKQKMKNND
jgi:hypothetical protein